MKRQQAYFLTILLLALTIQVFGQEAEPKFATAGEAEAYRARQFFKTDYKKEKRERYKGKITRLDKTTYKYDTVTLRVFDIEDELLAIFDNGLLSPTGHGSTISNIEELTDLNPNPTVRRFKYILHLRKIANPHVFFFELTNEKANSKTKAKEFIEGATTTFYKWGWVMI